MFGGAGFLPPYDVFGRGHLPHISEMGGFQTETTHLVKENARRGEEPSVDVGAFVAGRLLGRVETGDDEHHAAGRGNGVIAETLHEAAD